MACRLKTLNPEEGLHLPLAQAGATALVLIVGTYLSIRVIAVCWLEYKGA